MLLVWVLRACHAYCMHIPLMTYLVCIACVGVVDGPCVPRTAGCWTATYYSLSTTCYSHAQYAVLSCYLYASRASDTARGAGTTHPYRLRTSYDDDYTVCSAPHLRRIGSRLIGRLVDRSDLSSRRHRAAPHLCNGGAHLQARGLAAGRWRVGRCAGWRRRLEGARSHPISRVVRSSSSIGRSE